MSNYISLDDTYVRWVLSERLAYTVSLLLYFLFCLPVIHIHTLKREGKSTDF